MKKVNPISEEVVKNTFSVIEAFKKISSICFAELTPMNNGNSYLEMNGDFLEDVFSGNEKEYYIYIEIGEKEFSGFFSSIKYRLCINGGFNPFFLTLTKEEESYEERNEA